MKCWYQSKYRKSRILFGTPYIKVCADTQKSTRSYRSGVVGYSSIRVWLEYSGIWRRSCIGRTFGVTAVERNPLLSLVSGLGPI